MAYSAHNLDLVQVLERTLSQVLLPRASRPPVPLRLEPLLPPVRVLTAQEQRNLWIADLVQGLWKPQPLARTCFVFKSLTDLACTSLADLLLIQSLKPLEKMLAAVPFVQDAFLYSRVVISCALVFSPVLPLGLCPFLLKLLHAADSRVVEDACMAVAFFMRDSHKENNTAFTKKVLASDAIPRFVQLVSHPRPNLAIAALDVLHKVLTATDGGALDALIRSGAVACIIKGLCHPHVQMQHFALAIISIFKTSSQIQKFLENPSTAIDRIFALTGSDAKNVRTQATAALMNFCNRGTLRQVQFVAEKYRKYCEASIERSTRAG